MKAESLKTISNSKPLPGIEMDESLLQKHCRPCQGQEPTLTSEEIARLKPQVPGWYVTTVDGHPLLSRAFRFKDFVGSIDFVNQVKAVAEQEGHHPDVHIHWNIVRLENWTHAIGGLHQNDFILAAKINQLVT